MIVSKTCKGNHELDEQPCTVCTSVNSAIEPEEDFEEDQLEPEDDEIEEAFDRMLDAADAKYERDHDK